MRRFGQINDQTQNERRKQGEEVRFDSEEFLSPVGEMGRQQASPTILGATVGKHLLDEWKKGVEQRKNFCTSPQELRSNEGHGTN